MIYVQQALPGTNEPAIIYGEGQVALSGSVFLTTLIQKADHASIAHKLSNHPKAAASAPEPNLPRDARHIAPGCANP